LTRNSVNLLEATALKDPEIAVCDILERGRNNFDLVRLAAAASVIVSHSFLIAGGPLSVEPLAGISSFTLGQHAVAVFFILSGLLVAASLERNPEPVAFLGGRVLRVFPGLVACATSSWRCLPRSACGGGRG